MVKIKTVIRNSAAWRSGIRDGDILISINGQDVNDALDYHFLLACDRAKLHCSRNIEENGKIRRETYEVTLNSSGIAASLAFDNPLMDERRSCENACIFCFIDQLPPEMRSSLYYKDDDSRLSFLHGNYITLTNMYPHDIERIIRMKITPVNVSVHTTNPDLREFMMNNPRAGETLSYLRTLANSGCGLRAQIVLCRGINDRTELSRTMRDLAELHPQLDSVSIVPAGLTRYRETADLYPLEQYSPSECADIIIEVDSFADECEQNLGERIFSCADEFYVRAGIPIPPPEHYFGYPQFENGVGMLALFTEEFDSELADFDKTACYDPRCVSIATGMAAYEFIENLCGRVRSLIKNLEISVHSIKNKYFGESVTVAGLITGRDIADQLTSDDIDLGDELLIPSSMLRSEGDLFLCGMTPGELSDKLQVPVRIIKPDGGEFLRALISHKNNTENT